MYETEEIIQEIGSSEDTQEAINRMIHDSDDNRSSKKDFKYFRRGSAKFYA